MKAVYLAQCLCPQRHTIIATALEWDGEWTEEQNQWMCEALGNQLNSAIAGTPQPADQFGQQIPKLNPWCELCGATSKEWVFEVGRTKFQDDLAEAKPELERLQAAQRFSATLIKAMQRKAEAN